MTSSTRTLQPPSAMYRQPSVPSTNVPTAMGRLEFRSANSKTWSRGKLPTSSVIRACSPPETGKSRHKCDVPPYWRKVERENVIRHPTVGGRFEIVYRAKLMDSTLSRDHQIVSHSRLLSVPGISFFRPKAARRQGYSSTNVHLIMSSCPVTPVDHQSVCFKALDDLPGAALPAHVACLLRC